jgi:2-methylcitrate dehydratase PrpD
MNDPTGVQFANRSSVSLSHDLAQHIATTPYSAIPESAIAAAKFFMLDTLAVAWAGSSAPGCREAYELLVDEGGKGEATAWAYGGHLPLQAAAFINGMSSSALDYDALGRDAPVHVMVSVLPAALAVAEREELSGKEFMAALVLGSDVMCRLGAAASHPHKGWSYTSVLGTFGAAAAAARLLRLDTVKTRHALGMAFLQSAGTQQFNIEPSLSKRMLSAFAARCGVYAALLAQRGLTAPSQVIEGKFGLYNLYQGGDAASLLAGLGSEFKSEDLSIKKYPSCGCNHTAIEGTLQLVRQYDLKPDDVRAIEVTVTPYIERIVGGVYDPSGDAQVAAQFNIRYSIACALVRRKLGLAEIEADSARDPAILKHVDKVTVVVDRALKSERGPVLVKMVTGTNGEISRYVEHVPGSSESPLSEEEIKLKAQECFALGVRPLKRQQMDEFSSRISAIENSKNLSALFEGVC